MTDPIEVRAAYKEWREQFERNVNMAQALAQVTPFYWVDILDGAGKAAKQWGTTSEVVLKVWLKEHGVGVDL